MKSLLLLVLSIVLTSLSLSAQNWSLVMPNDTLVYEKQDNNQFFTVWVDSTHVNGTDTTYFMNRIISERSISLADSTDYCYGIGFSNMSAPAAYNSKKTEAHFFGSQIVQSVSKSIIWYGSKSYVIYPANSIGSSWVMDSTTMDSMRVVSIDTAFLDLYQTIDSVKVLEFNNKNILISKNHGLISGFDLRDTNQYIFKSIGVQNLHLGETIPMAKDIYDFEVGDIFFRKSGGGDSDEIRITTSKIRILTKTLTSDSVFYSVQINSQLYTYSPQWGNPHYFPKEQYNSTLKYSLNESEELSNALPGSLGRTVYPYWSVDMFTNTFVYRNSSNQIEKRNANPNFGWPYMKAICKHDSFLVHQFIHGTNRVFVKNLGKVTDEYNGGLQMGSDNLIGYIKANGESWGDTTYTSVNELDYSNLISIYPNPTNNLINITTEKINGTSILEMYDLRGQLITTKTFERDLTLDVSQWSSGVYFAIIKDADGVVLHREKIVIK